MVIFGSGVSAASSARAAAIDAARQASRALEGTGPDVASRGDGPKLAIVFASVTYPDVAEVASAVREVVGEVPVVGGTAGACVFGEDACIPRGVSVVLLGGDDLEVETRVAEVDTPSLVETVPAAEAVAKSADAAARRGFPHYVCLVFAPGIFVDGEALVAAVRKGAGARAQLAGALTGDDLTMDRPGVFAGVALRSNAVVVTGLFSRRPIGISARHGYRAVGEVRTVTRADGVWLVELDGRPALDVWLEDARGAGADPPPARRDVALYLANHFELGLLDGPPTPRAGRPSDLPEEAREFVARAPFAVRDDGAVQLSASIPEGAHVRVLHATSRHLLRASAEAASSAAARAGLEVAGALVLACSGRLAALGDAFASEPAQIRGRVGGPIGGACVFGEIARNVRDADAFFNTTTVVVAFGR